MNRSSNAAEIRPALENSVPQLTAEMQVGRDILIYVRSSSDEQSRSCPQQIKAAEYALQAAGVLRQDERLATTHAPDRGIFADEGVSGWRYAPEERPGSSELITRCRADRRPRDNPGTIIIWSLSRLGRFADGPEQAIHCLYDLRRCGWVVRSLTQPGLDSEDDDRLLRVIRSALESDKDTSASEEKSKLVSRGKQEAIAAGYWHGGAAPLGYERWACRESPGGEIKWLEVLPPGKRNGNPDSFTLLRPGTDARIVRDIFRWFDIGTDGQRLSMRAIARLLNEQEAPQGRGGEGWGHTSVRKILTNEAYISLQRGARGEARPALWESMIDRESWMRVRARLCEKPTRGKAANSEFILSGLIACAACKAVMWGERARSGRGYRFYYRPKLENTGARQCGSCRRIPIEDVDRAVLSAIGSVADHPKVIKAIRDEEQMLSGGMDAHRERLRAIAGEIADAEMKIDYLLEFFSLGGATTDIVRAKVEKLNRVIDRLKGEQEKLKGASDERRVHKFADESRRFSTIFVNATAAEKRALVRCFISRILLDVPRGKLQVMYRSPE